jgi:hypothetical protein
VPSRKTPATSEEARARRLAEALRSNIKKRKAQRRGIEEAGGKPLKATDTGQKR